MTTLLNILNVSAIFLVVGGLIFILYAFGYYDRR